MQASDPVLARRLLHGSWHALRHLETVLAAAGPLDLTEMVVLEHAVHGDLGPSAIADALRLRDDTVSRALGRLDAAGLIERRLDASDGRRRMLVPTDAGRALLDRLHAALRAHVGSMLEDHEPAHLDAFARVLTAIVAADAPSERRDAVSGPGAAPSGAHRGSAPRRR